MSASPTQVTKTYNTEDLQQILQLAIARQAYQGEFTQEQLLEIAAELEISADCLQAAQQDWLDYKVEEKKRQEFNAYRKGRLKHKLGKYLIVNTFLVALNSISAATLSWSLYILLFWGVWIALDAWKNYQLQGEEYEQAFRQWERKHQLKHSLGIIWDKFQKAMQA